MASSEEQSFLEEGDIYVALSHSSLDILSAIARVKRPSAGAVVMFAGTTRNTFSERAVSHLSYSAYIPLALRTLLAISRAAHAKHALQAVAVLHRLGDVPIGEESILVVVSAKHRAEGWKGGEEILEECKTRAEIWKLETFADGEQEGEWRSNEEQKRMTRKT